MKQGGHPNRSGGFTIVETLIVLAVTGILLVSALAYISGRQNTTAFQVSINNLQQQLQQVINQTASGYYPDTNNFSCTATLGSLPVIKQLPAGAPAAAQGANSDCVLVGNLLRFNTVQGDGASKGMTAGSFSVYPLVANRAAINTATGYTAAEGTLPVALAKGSSTNPNNKNAPDDITTYQLENGLSYAAGGGGPSKFTPTGHGLFLAAILTDLQSSNSAQAGSQQLSIHSFALPSQPTNSQQLVDDVPTSLHTVVNYFEICIASGTTNQSGLLSIHGTGSLTVDLDIRAGTTC